MVVFTPINFDPRVKWCRSKIREELSKGTSVVVDRYAYSGVAFTAAKQVSENALEPVLFQLETSSGSSPWIRVCHCRQLHVASTGARVQTEVCPPLMSSSSLNSPRKWRKRGQTLGRRGTKEWPFKR